MKPLQITRLGYAMGASIGGLDLSQPLDDATLAAVRQAWLDHVVLCFPGQSLSPEQMMAFCSRFGELDDNRRVPEGIHPDYPAVKILSNKPVVVAGKRLHGERPGLTRWHSDQSYSDHPATATFLHALEMPEVGGDTMFANMYLAYETLSPKLREILEGLSGVHDHSLTPQVRKVSEVGSARDKRRNPPIAHPAVIVHPESGRKALFINPRVRNFLGMTEEESRPLLDFLNRHAVRYEFLYRHRYTVGDVVMWDNRCALHLPVPDYDFTQMRRLIRCMILGPKTGTILAQAG